MQWRIQGGVVGVITPPCSWNFVCSKSNFSPTGAITPDHPPPLWPSPPLSENPVSAPDMYTCVTLCNMILSPYLNISLIVGNSPYLWHCSFDNYLPALASVSYVTFISFSRHSKYRKHSSISLADSCPSWWLSEWHHGQVGRRAMALWPFNWGVFYRHISGQSKASTSVAGICFLCCRH